MAERLSQNTWKGDEDSEEGLTLVKAQVNYEKVIQHFMKVNNCSKKEFETHRDIALILWAERSECKWKLKLSKWSKLIE